MTTCKVREDLVEYHIPLEHGYIIPDNNKEYQCRWIDDDTFQVKIIDDLGKNIWVNAYSIDFEF